MVCPHSGKDLRLPIFFVACAVTVVFGVRRSFTHLILSEAPGETSDRRENGMTPRTRRRRLFKVGPLLCRLSYRRMKSARQESNLDQRFGFQKYPTSTHRCQLTVPRTGTDQVFHLRVEVTQSYASEPVGERGIEPPASASQMRHSTPELHPVSSVPCPYPMTVGTYYFTFSHLC